jgi:hypothetical protein
MHKRSRWAASPSTTFWGRGPGGNDGGAYDYYSFTLPNGATGAFDIDYQPGFAPMGIAITSFDGVTETMLAQSFDQDGSELVVYTNTSGVAMDLYVLVFSDDTWLGTFGGYELMGSLS